MPADTGKSENSIGSVILDRPDEPIDPKEISLAYRNDADFGGIVRLLGYNLPNDNPRPGHTSFIDFYRSFSKKITYI